MDLDRIEEHIWKIEGRLLKLESELKSLSRREKRLHNLVLRLAAINMAVTEAMQKHGQIKPEQFEERVERFLNSLDQEISEKKTGLFLDKIWKQLEDKE